MNHHPTARPTSQPPAAPAAADDAPAVLDRRDGPFGEVVLRRHGELLQIIANGSFLMDTSDGRSERLLVRSALTALTTEAEEAEEAASTEDASEAADSRRTGPRAEARSAPSVLIGGLGVGFSLAEAVADPRWGSITVVEREPAVLEWHRDGGPLAPFTAAARADSRTRLVCDDLLGHLRNTAFRYDALCLDVDNGPEWTVTEENEGLYSPAGLATAHARLTPGGILVVWSAQPSAVFGAALLDAGFCAVRAEEVPVARGVPDVIHLARRMP